MSLRTAIRTLLIVAVALPVASLSLRFVATLLAAMEDAPGAAAVRGVATACAATWPVALVGLLLVLAFDASRRHNASDASDGSAAPEQRDGE
jgi:hypothetical protein